jgi:hypothetical protein
MPSIFGQHPDVVQGITVDHQEIGFTSGSDRGIRPRLEPSLQQVGSCPGASLRANWYFFSNVVQVASAVRKG